MADIRRVSYSKGDQRELERWLDHIIEDTILQHLNVEPEEEVGFRSVKYMENRKG